MFPILPQHLSTMILINFDTLSLTHTHTSILFYSLYDHYDRFYPYCSSYMIDPIEMFIIDLIIRPNQYWIERDSLLLSNVLECVVQTWFDSTIKKTLKHTCIKCGDMIWLTMLHTIVLVVVVVLVLNGLNSTCVCIWPCKCFPNVSLWGDPRVSSRELAHWTQRQSVWLSYSCGSIVADDSLQLPCTSWQINWPFNLFTHTHTHTDE